jgi:adenosylmethionine-8-amino-7-oxononanoate aminotransferase
VSEVISSGNPGVFMHGPTFMGNPLACAVAIASLKLLLESNWQQQINDLQNQLSKELAPCAALPSVADVRVLGNIGVLEMQAPLNVAEVQKQLVDLGVWIRPFGKLFYIIVPYVISSTELTQLTNAMYTVAKQIQ